MIVPDESHLLGGEYLLACVTLDHLLLDGFFLGYPIVQATKGIAPSQGFYVSSQHP